MNTVNLSKSKYCKAVQCNKILWLDKYKKEYAVDTADEAVLENGTEVGNLAKDIFGEHINIEYEENLYKMIENTQIAMKEKPNIITEASFEYKDNSCSVDILKNDVDGVEIYEVKSSTHITDIYLDDISYQVYVLLQLGYNVKKASLVYINNEYVRQGELELDKLFKIEDVTEIAFMKQDGIASKLEEIDEYMSQKEEPKKDIGEYCFNPYACAYWEYCTRNLPEENVFKIREMRTSKKLDLYYKGKINFEDLIFEDLNPKYLEQIDFELNNKNPKINKKEIEEFLNTLSYPIYFLDFETYHQPIPRYDGIRPYMQIPFQYSLHYIEKEDGELKHKEFLAEAGTDPRRELAERLIEDIPNNVCILAYNMKFEKMVIKDLAETYSDLKEDLLKIKENIRDLMIPFKNRNYYAKEMQGSYSIKYVLPALFPNSPELDYNKLPVVHNGGEAMTIFANLEKCPKEEQERIRKGLLEYCKLDTLAMVKIWEKLKEIKSNRS